MAVLRGEQGAVQFDAAGSSNATIVGTRSWSLTIDQRHLRCHHRSWQHFPPASLVA
jgi:hypothetical protein